MRQANKRGELVFYYLAVLIFIVMTLGPIVWTLVISLSHEQGMFSASDQFLPQDVTWVNYQTLFDLSRGESVRFMLGLKNSLQACGLTIIIGLPLCVLAAYSFVFFDYPLKQTLLRFFIFTTVIPLLTTIIPLYKMFSDFHLLDKPFFLALVYISSFMPMIIWILVNYFKQIPREIIEAAKMDGSKDWRLLVDIILPNSLPILLSVALILFLMTWSQFQIPLILSSSRMSKPLSIVLSEYSTKDTVQYGLMAAAGVLAILPPAFIAVVFRKYLISGLANHSSK